MAEQFPRTTLIFIRHGQATPGDGPYGPTTPLSQLGRRQVAALAQVLETGEAVDAFYTSPFVRAVQTAELLRGALGLEPIADPRLAEFEVPGATAETVGERLDLQFWRPEHKSATGETLAEFCARVADFCEEAVRRHAGERVAVVSHSGTIHAKIRWALGIGPEAPWEHEFGNPNASITEIVYWPRGRVSGGAPRHAELLRIGDTTHLGAMATDI